MKSKFKKVVVPKFIFTDGSLGVFSGFDRNCHPEGSENPPEWIWTLGLFDVDGNYFVIELDTRKKLKTPTIFHDEKPYFHPIIKFSTIGCKVNPKNGHLI